MIALPAARRVSACVWPKCCTLALYTLNDPWVSWEDLETCCDRGHSVAWSRMCLWCLRLTWPREELFGVVGCSTWHNLSAAPKSLLKNRDPILNPNLSDALWISLILFFEISEVLRIEAPDLVYCFFIIFPIFSISLCFTVPIGIPIRPGPRCFLQTSATCANACVELRAVARVGRRTPEPWEWRVAPWQV